MFPDLSIYQSGIEQCEPSHSFGPAVRDFYLLHCILKGKGRFCVGNKQYDLSAGQGFLIFPEILTYYKADQDDPWEYTWVGFQGDHALDILLSCGLDKENPVFKIKDLKQVKQCISDMKINYESTQEQYYSIGKLYEFFSLIEGPVKKEKEKETICQKAADYIYKNYSNHITVGKIANLLSVERSYLFRMFKKEYQMSVQSYLIEYRLKKASQLLKTTNLTITEIMYSSGFNDLPHFSREFKKRYKKTPSDYRKS